METTPYEKKNFMAIYNQCQIRSKREDFALVVIAGVVKMN